MKYERFANTHLKVVNQNGNEINALCPLPDHPERHPSFRFNVKTGLWMCMGCGEKGNAIMLAQRLGVNLLTDVASSDTLRRRSGALRRHGGRPDDQRTMRMAETALRRFESSSYWTEKRGFSEATVRRFQLGYDPISERLTIPIRNSYGELLGVIYRRTDDGKPKYLNPRGFARGRSLFASWHMRKSAYERVALTEGPLDAVACWDAGIPAMSLFGASITDGQVKLMQSLSIRQAVIFTDNDKAGAIAAVQVTEKLRGTGMHSRIAEYTTNHKDPGEMPGGVLRNVYEETCSRFVRTSRQD